MAWSHDPCLPFSHLGLELYKTMNHFCSDTIFISVHFLASLVIVSSAQHGRSVANSPSYTSRTIYRICAHPIQFSRKFEFII